MTHYPLIEQAIRYIDAHHREQPDLATLARALNMSPFHLQRVFKDWVGISPKKFMQYLTLRHARQQLQKCRSVLDAAYASGLSGPGRLHDLFVNIQSITPGEYRRACTGLKIYYGKSGSPFGECMLAASTRGVCFMGFYAPDKQHVFMDDMRRRFPGAVFIENQQKTEPYFDRIFKRPHENRGIELFLKGTPFQLQVWEALLRIPEGLVCSYGDIARMIGKPRAGRAVGHAVGQNPVSYLIPCHRVIRNMGITGDYHWGATRKKALLAWEAARRDENALL